jgi:hypothetical protein
MCELLSQQGLESPPFAKNHGQPAQEGLAARSKIEAMLLPAMSLIEPTRGLDVNEDGG